MAGKRLEEGVPIGRQALFGLVGQRKQTCEKDLTKARGCMKEQQIPPGMASMVRGTCLLYTYKGKEEDPVTLLLKAGYVFALALTNIPLFHYLS